MSSPSPQPRASFGSFEVNPSTGELRKQGIRIKLHEKPLQVLLALLEHPGDVVRYVQADLAGKNSSFSAASFGLSHSPSVASNNELGI